MPKIGRTLSYINTERKGKSTEQSSVSQSLGSSRHGGSVSMPQGDYLLKSIWDKVFEIRTDSQGREYIFGKLPMVTQYGITMYSGDGVDIPSLASGLPFDGRTIWYNPDTNQIEVIGGTGGGSGEGVSNFWDLSGIPSWITNSKPKYTYSEIEGTPDLTKYALASQIPSLSGYATESWVLQKNYATKATTLSGYGITDAYTKTNVDDLLKSYVTLGGTPQTITGEKNFTGGLKVNGSPIYYDTEKKYWKLEGDLLVTGGVTMYGSDSSFTPSTIMDAIAVDGTTISKSGGVLKVIGGTGGGVADSVAWANITGKPTWIGSSKPSYSYSEITGAISTTELQNYLTSNSYLNVTEGDNRYLKLSGGTISGTYGALIIHRTSDKSALIKYSNTSGDLGYLGFNSSKEPFVYKGTDTTTSYKIWHTGNDGSGSGLDADKLDGVQLNELFSSLSSGSTNKVSITIGGVTKNITTLYATYTNNFRVVWNNPTSGTYELNDLVGGFVRHYGSGGSLNNAPSSFGNGAVLALSNGTKGLSGQLAWNIVHNSTSNVTNKLWWRAADSTNGFTYSQWKQIAFTNSNVASATKLETARTIWGQSFDGTNNVDGRFTMTSDSGLPFKIGWLSTENTVQMWSWDSGTGFSDLCIGASKDTPAKALYFSGANGYWGIGTITPEYKLHVVGTSLITGASSFGSSVTLTGTSSTTARFIMSRSSYNYINYPTDGKLCFGTSNSSASTQLYIDGATGNVGIGTVEPSAKFHVKGTSHLRGTVYVTNADATTMVEDSGKIKFNSLNTRDDLRSPYIQAIHQANYSRKRLSIFQSNATNYTDDFVEVFTILPNGNVGIGTSSPTSKLHVSGDILATGAMTFYSMRKLKNVVDERGLSLNELSTIKPTRYTWKDGRDNRLHFGGIADDVQQVLPEVVYSTSDGILTMDYGNAAFAVASSLIQPVVDHEKRIAMLEEENKQLRQEVERLKSA